MNVLWFAFKLVSLNHWEQYLKTLILLQSVVICFQISIFEPLGTIFLATSDTNRRLWFAFKLVSLNHWEQFWYETQRLVTVVICFQISIFEPLGTIKTKLFSRLNQLWFAFKLVSLNHWEQSGRQKGGHIRSCDLLSN